MWYLIVPPVIVVVSLLFVLWYLSRKGTDPAIAEKAKEIGMKTERKISFLRTKTFFFRVLEKTAQRFKVQSLKMHNAFHSWTQSIKERRRYFQENAPVAEPAKGEVKPADRRSFLKRFLKKGDDAVVVGEKPEEHITGDRDVSVAPYEASTLEAPIVRRRKEITTVAGAHSAYDRESAIRPMVSEAVARPEIHKRPASALREEDFIARIAANPKDFTAYEGLGDYYLDTGNVKDAKECYRQVLKLSPVHRMVKIKIRRLEKILSQKSQEGTVEE